MRAKWAGKIIWELNCCKRSDPIFFLNWHFSTNSRKVKIRLFIFFPEETCLFSTFSRSEYLFPKSVSPPPSESNGRPLTHVTCIKNTLRKCNFMVQRRDFHACILWLWLVGWLVVLGIYVASAVFQPYHDLEAGDNQSLKIQVARPGIKPGPLAPQAKTLTTLWLWHWVVTLGSRSQCTAWTKRIFVQNIKVLLLSFAILRKYYDIKFSCNSAMTLTIELWPCFKVMKTFHVRRSFYVMHENATITYYKNRTKKFTVTLTFQSWACVKTHGDSSLQKEFMYLYQHKNICKSTPRPWNSNVSEVL